MTDPVRIYVDSEGRPVEEGDPRTARVLVGRDAEEALRRGSSEEPERRPARRGRGAEA